MSNLTEHIDHVGSLLRPPDLVAAYGNWLGSGKSEMPPSLRGLLHDAMLATMGRLAGMGLPITNGEYPRVSYLDLTRLFDASAFNMTEGYELTWHSDAENPAPPKMMQIKAPVVADRLRPTEHHILKDEGQFLLRGARLLGSNSRTKITLPSPAHVGLLGWKEGTSDKIYPTRQSLMEEVTKRLEDEAERLAQAGIDIVQVDSPTYHNLADKKLAALWRRRGVDFETLLPAIIECDNRILTAAQRGGAKAALHICMGNGSGYRLAECSYGEIGRKVFPHLKADELLLEYSNAISGESGKSRYEPLRHVRPGTKVALGLYSSKHAELEDPDEIRHQIVEAQHFVPLEKLALTPQCGFASAFTGNPLTVAQQWKKLESMIDTARTIW